MRQLPGWMVAVGIIGWFLATMACGGAAFVGTRSFVITAGADIPLPAFRAVAQGPTATSLLPIETPILPTTVLETTVPGAATEPPAADLTTVSPTAVPTEAPAVAEVPQDDNALVRGAVQRLGPRAITVLLLGIDQRSAVESADTEFFRTDTVIVLRLDPVRRTAGMLSIPRDLYLEIPGFRAGRINTANYLGDSNAYPGGGPALAMETVEELIGIPIDNYVLVNFDVFTTVVDTVAPRGVEVCVQEPIFDPDYPDEAYGFIEVRFDTGCQRLDSERLLQYARTRATQGADFDRARRQQQVITAIQNEVTSAGGLVTLVARAPALWAELAGNLRTDMDFEKAVDVALLATTVDRDNIQMGVIDNLYVTFDTDEQGQQILVPSPSSIAALVQDTFNNQGDLTLDDLRERATQENASITILNNTTIQGLAGRTQTWLSGNGVSTTTGNAQTPNGADTVIRDYTGKPWTSRYIAAVMGLPRDRILSGTDGATSADIAIVVGPDVEAIIGGG
jgi:polyisoprenyl-teichoic acid--peptidoglycan teichoic acid transferase